MGIMNKILGAAARVLGMDDALGFNASRDAAAFDTLHLHPMRAPVRPYRASRPERDDKTRLQAAQAKRDRRNVKRLRDAERAKDGQAILDNYRLMIQATS